MSRVFWWWYALFYDYSLGRLLPYQELHDEVRRRILEACPPNDPAVKFLDLGTGTGKVLQGLQQSDVAWDLTGIDWLRAMLRRAHRKVPEVRFLRADLNKSLAAQGCEGPYRGFAAVNVAYNLDLRKLLIRLREVAADDAFMVLTTPKKDPNPRKVWKEHVRLTRERGVRSHGIWSQFPLLLLNLFIARSANSRFYTPDEIREACKGTGWRVTGGITYIYGGNTEQSGQNLIAMLATGGD